MSTYLIKGWFIACSLSFSMFGFAQPGQEDGIEGTALLIHLQYGIQWPGGGNIQQRYGQNFAIGGGPAILLKKNFLIGINYSLLFGNQVKEDVLAPLRTPEGLLIGNDMQFASVFLRERGWSLHVDAGYLFPLRPDKTRQSGILTTVGAGALSHHIRFVDEFDSAIQITPPYDKGYDRLSYGWSLHQSIGYLHLAKNRLLNFHIGINIIEGFTKNRRGFNYDLARFDSSTSTDILVGFKIGWILPFYLFKRTIYY